MWIGETGAFIREFCPTRLTRRPVGFRDVNRAAPPAGPRDKVERLQRPHRTDRHAKPPRAGRRARGIDLGPRRPVRVARAMGDRIRRAGRRARRASSRFAAAWANPPPRWRAAWTPPRGLQARLMRLSTFAYLRNAQDGTNPELPGRDRRRVGALARGWARASRSSTPRSWPCPTASSSASCARTTALAAHRVPLERLLETRPHRLGAETEGVLAALGEVLGSPYMVYERSKASDIQFAPFVDAQGVAASELVQPLRTSYEAHADTAVRRGAWASFSAGLKAYNNTYAATIATEVKKNVVLARLRGYPSTEDVPAAVAPGAARAVHRHPADHPHRARPAHAALPAPAPARAGPRQGASLRPARAAGRRLRAADRVRGGLRHAAGLAGADGRRVRGLRAHGADPALGGSRRQRRQVVPARSARRRTACTRTS